ncbi:MAG TPA: PIN domain-containing protein [Ktedonobacterales bacterium]|nr:PIN domain-containing protein [Ktedonobacterales bacterium]
MSPDQQGVRPIRAVVDTSSLVPANLRRDLQQAAQLGAFIAIWSPWIIAELNRVLVWRWIVDPPTGIAAGDLSQRNQRRCSEAAKTMMQWLVPSFELVNPLPPYPPVWASLSDAWDHPIWAAAKMGQAQYVISENTHDFPPRSGDGRAIHEGVEYIQGAPFLAMLSGALE